jgi:steroid 5-alpha reductase family enzyme
MKELLPILLLLVAGHSVFWFIVSLVLKRNDVADIAWGLSFIVVTAYCWLSLDHSPGALFISSLVFVWGIRLAIHVFTRNISKAEDPRYAKWRAEWGKLFYIRSFFQVFLLQGLIMLLIASPVFLSYLYPREQFGVPAVIGGLVWIVGFIFESLGDYQLSFFIKDSANKGKIMDRGLWRYTRHPNYFGEVTMWWGIFVIGLSVTKGFYGIISPITITYLLLFVSGIPMLEERYKGNKDFEKYKEKTSAFFPMFPKK